LRKHIFTNARKTKRKNKEGSVVEYFQLAHNERHLVTRKPVAKIIQNFGRTGDLDREELVRPCRSIARVCGVTIVDPMDEEQGRLLCGEAGLPSDLKIKNTVSFGCVYAIEALWEELSL